MPNAVAEQMKVKLLGQSARPDAARSNQNPAAHNAVLQSDFYFQQQTADSLRKAIAFLQEAVRLDPNYALAYAKLSQAWRQYAASFAIEDAPKAYEEARQAADKAVSLAPDLVDVRMTVGLLAMNPELDFPAAEKEFRQVLQSSPNHAAAKSVLGASLSGARSIGRSRGSLSGGAFVRPSPHELMVQYWPNRCRNGSLQGSRGSVSQRT